MKRFITIIVTTVTIFANPTLFIKLKELKNQEFIPFYKEPKIIAPILFKLESNSYIKYLNATKEDKINGIKWLKVEKDGKSGWILNSFIVKDKIVENKSRNKKNKTFKSNNNIANIAKSKINSPYKYATAGPNTFDCSGFVYWVYKENNITIPRTSLNQSKIGVKVDKDNLKVGDLLFFDTSDKGHVNHSGIYLGNNKFIHASSGKAFSVVISPLNKGFYKSKFLFAKRVAKESNRKK